MLLVVLFLAVALVDRLGRKMLLLISGAGVILSSTLFGLFFQLQDSNHLKLNGLAIASVLSFLMFFGLGWSAIPWLLMSELLPTKARGIASSISTCFNWSCGFVVAYFFIDIENGISSQGVFWFFAGFTLVAELFIYKFLPETKGKTLEEIQTIFDPNIVIEEPSASYGSDILGEYSTFDKTQSLLIIDNYT